MVKLVPGSVTRVIEPGTIAPILHTFTKEPEGGGGLRNIDLSDGRAGTVKLASDIRQRSSFARGVAIGIAVDGSLMKARAIMTVISRVVVAAKRMSTRIR